MGKKLSNDDIWDDIVREVDLDGDGCVSYEEFKTMMIKFLNNESTKSQISISVGGTLKTFNTS